MTCYYGLLQFLSVLFHVDTLRGGKKIVFTLKKWILITTGSKIKFNLEKEVKTHQHEQTTMTTKRLSISDNITDKVATPLCSSAILANVTDLKALNAL